MYPPTGLLLSVRMGLSQNAIRIYRQLLEQARRLPPDQKADALQRIREGFRGNKGIAEAER